VEDCKELRECHSIGTGGGTASTVAKEGAFNVLQLMAMTLRCRPRLLRGIGSITSGGCDGGQWVQWVCWHQSCQ
jgi:hypothetical protein